MKTLFLLALLTSCSLAHAGDTKIVTLPDGKVMTCQTTNSGVVCW